MAAADQLQEHMAQASIHLQAIQDILSPDGRVARVRFPRGYSNPVRDRIGRLGWIDDNALRRNLCYHPMFSTVSFSALLS